MEVLFLRIYIYCVVFKYFYLDNFKHSYRLQVLEIAPRLLPFVITTVSYFLLSIPKDSPSMLAALVKCAPIYCLIYFVLKAGVSPYKK